MSSTDSKKFLKIEVSGIEKIALCNNFAQGVRIFAVKIKISTQYGIRPHRSEARSGRRGNG